MYSTPTSGPLPAATSVKSAGGLTNSAAAIKASSGTVYGWHLDNTANTEAIYFQFFNVASGSVTVGTTAPYFSLCIPGGGAANISFGGIMFSTAISIAATKGFSNNVAPTNPVTFSVFYI